MLSMKRKLVTLVVLSLFLGCKEKGKMWQPDGPLVKRNKKGKVTETIPSSRASKEYRCFNWDDIRTMASYIRQLEQK